MKIVNLINVKDLIYLLIILAILFSAKCNSNMEVKSNGNLAASQNKIEEKKLRKLEESCFEMKEQINSLMNKCEILQTENAKKKTTINTLLALLTKEKQQLIDTVFEKIIVIKDSITDPKYGFDVHNEWFDFNGIVSYDTSIITDIQIKNKYKVVIQKKRKNIFKMNYEVKLTNENPYSVPNNISFNEFGK